MRLTRAAMCRSIALSCLAAVSASPVLAKTIPPATLLELVSKQPELATFLSAVRSAGLEPMLTGTDHVTLFAPTNEAFAKLPEAELTALLAVENRERLRRVVLGHVVKGVVVFHGDGDITEGSLLTAGDGSLTIAQDRGGLTVGGARLVHTDMRAGNGMLTTIDRVLL